MLSVDQKNCEDPKETDFCSCGCRQGMTRVMYREPPQSHPAPENTLPAPQYPADLYLRRQNELGSFSWRMGKAQKTMSLNHVWTFTIHLVGGTNRPEHRMEIVHFMTWQLAKMWWTDVDTGLLDLATCEDVVNGCGYWLTDLLVPSNTLANVQLAASIRVAVTWHLCDTCLATQRNPKLSRILRVAGSEKKPWWTQGRSLFSFWRKTKTHLLSLNKGTEKHWTTTKNKCVTEQVKKWFWLLLWRSSCRPSLLQLLQVLILPQQAWSFFWLSSLPGRKMSDFNPQIVLKDSIKQYNVKYMSAMYKIPKHPGINQST